ncbi:hypothetical protein [Culicoidibacter larvae]|uniref:YjcQ protein n=1 Tax=Culicoidibacter larvae TaxID=2579976 RepID=A0A5R8QGV3_9FIRM|nr:hypothetical protein [Culicoidibacter larvae]TLG76693.1 hypothetical protein FEZ08_03505 [Culicoidibacter larvae]
MIDNCENLLLLSLLETIQMNQLLFKQNDCEYTSQQVISFLTDLNQQGYLDIYINEKKITDLYLIQNYINNTSLWGTQEVSLNEAGREKFSVKINETLKKLI